MESSVQIGRQRIALVLVSFLVVVFALIGRLVGGEEQREATYGDLDTFTEVLHLVNTSYVDPVGDDALMIGAFRGMLANLDPKSGWLSPDEVKALDQKEPRIDIGVETTKRSGYAYTSTRNSRMRLRAVVGASSSPYRRQNR